MKYPTHEGLLRRLCCGSMATLMTLSLLSGCSAPDTGTPGSQTNAPSLSTEAATETPAATIPPDGNPDDVTCKGSYTADAFDTDMVVAFLNDPVPDETEPAEEETFPTTDATIPETTAATESTDPTAETIPEDAPPVCELTLGQLQVFYWMEAAAYRRAGSEPQPDWEQPLDTQTCQLEGSTLTWQQYFLRKALTAWHTAQALVRMGYDEGLPTEEAYQPNLENHSIYLSEKPATRWLYGYNDHYQPNELHQAYLDSIPTLLAELAQETGYAGTDALAQAATGVSGEALEHYTRLYNLGYMYFTNLHYYLTPAEGETAAYFAENEKTYADAGITRDSGFTVDFRHILLIPQGATAAADGAVSCSEDAWEACETQAHAMLSDFLKNRDHSEPRFAELAWAESADAGSALNGGAYRSIHQGQLTQSLDEWLFQQGRQPGDTTVLRTDAGVHILYFSGSRDIWQAVAEQDLTSQMARDLTVQVRQTYTMTVDYSAISLGLAEDTGSIAPGDVLYPDVAHQRYPVAQLYLQQDYPTTKYGAYKITTHGCGITTMAMLATYMTDTELTPPTLCGRYANYVHLSGTDGMLFNYTPAEMGFYLRFKTYQPEEALRALEEGYPVVCVQQKGYWTRGGHYLLLEKVNPDGSIQVRDSNIFNYNRLLKHKVDAFPWGSITPAGMGYWVFDKKITAIPACSRCGDCAGTEGIPEVMFQEDYLCEKCNPAIDRRNNYLAYCAG